MVCTAHIEDKQHHSLGREEVTALTGAELPLFVVASCKPTAA